MMTGPRLGGHHNNKKNDSLYNFLGNVLLIFNNVVSAKLSRGSSELFWSKFVRSPPSLLSIS